MFSFLRYTINPRKRIYWKENLRWGHLGDGRVYLQDLAPHFVQAIVLTTQPSNLQNFYTISITFILSCV